MSMKNLVLRVVRALSVAAVLVVVGAAAMPGKAKADLWSCNVFTVSEFIGTNQRIGVLCSNPITLNGQTVQWLALGAGSTNTAQAARFLSVAQAALLSGKPLVVDVPAVFATSTGCVNTNCRIPTWYSINF